MATDILQGCFVVGCTLCALISLVLLREQVAHGGGPEWLEDPAGEHPGGAAGQGGVAEGVLERALRGFANNNPAQPAQNQQVGDALKGTGSQPVDPFHSDSYTILCFVMRLWKERERWHFVLVLVGNW